jgi:diguanylate cyclase (GGDEF)-like protein
MAIDDALPAKDTGPSARILIADDDPDIRFLLGRVLERAGYEVLTAPDGGQALQLAHQNELDLVILDVSMPEPDGYAVCREIQTNGPNPPLVIFLTAHARTSARVTGLDSGAVDWITKPFDPDELRARVRAALRTKTARDALAIEAAQDALTGLLNRAQLAQRSGELVSLALRTDTPLTCLMIDLDGFKAINDAHGHGVGDSALVEVARRIRDALRTSDSLFRFGGDEFVALLPDTDEGGALSAAERLLASLREAPFSVAREDGTVTELALRVSIGLAAWTPFMADGDLLIAAADEALYRAKTAGRDRVEVARPAWAA